MQTTGAALLAVKRCSVSRAQAFAQDSHSVHGLLYFAAVRGDICSPKRRQASVDTYVSIDRLTAPGDAGSESVQGNPTGDRPAHNHALPRIHRSFPTLTSLPTSPGGCGAPHGRAFRAWPAAWITARSGSSVSQHDETTAPLAATSNRGSRLSRRRGGNNCTCHTDEQSAGATEVHGSPDSHGHGHGQRHDDAATSYHRDSADSVGHDGNCFPATNCDSHAIRGDLLLRWQLSMGRPRRCWHPCRRHRNAGRRDGRSCGTEATTA